MNIQYCKNCHFAFQWPLSRSSDESASEFEIQYKNKETGGYFDKDRRDQIAQMQLAFIRTLSAPNINLLDVGCGDGVFAKLAATQSYKVTGMDPALPNVNPIYFQQQNLKLLKANLSDLDPEIKYSIITCWDVIEHINDIDEFLSSLYNALTPGGILVIETGNLQSLDRIVNGSRWWGWQLDHRHYFSPPTLEPLLKRSGFSQIEFSPTALRPWIDSSKPVSFNQELFNIAKSLIKNPKNLFATLEGLSLLHHSQRKWKAWFNLPIFTMTARRTE